MRRGLAYLATTIIMTRVPLSVRTVAWNNGKIWQRSGSLSHYGSIV